MGLKDWFAKDAPGAGAYGESIGRSTAENGLALGRVLYLAHGTYSGTAKSWVFEDAESMVAEGYSVYCKNASEKPPMEDRSNLSILTRAAGIAFAAKIAMNAAQCFSKQENIRNFNRSIGAANASYVSQHSSEVPMALVTQFVHLAAPSTVTMILNLREPGTGDMFGVFLKEIANQNHGGAVGFQRSGLVGFDTWAVSLAEETVSSIQKAAMNFRW